MDELIFINPDAKTNRDAPNLQLAYAATHFQSKVIDLNTMPDNGKRFLNFPSLVVGISVQSRTLGEAGFIEAAYKEKFPSSKVKSVSGFIDIQCCYPFIGLDGGIRFDEPFSDKYPFPDYEVFDSFGIFKKNWERGVWDFPLMTSLGCPYQCVFCMSRNRLWLKRSAENCAAELKAAKEKWNIKSFVVMDDCFNFDKKRVIDFCGAIKPLSLGWSCNNGIRADRFDRDMAEAMSSSGCVNIGFGIETTDPEILKTIKKGETLDDIERAVKTAKKYFKKVNGFFVIGLPGSTYEKDVRGLKWAIKKGLNAHFSYHVASVDAADKLFWGESACPASKAYPHELQRKLYRLTGCMRGEARGFLKRAVSRAKLIWLFDRENVFHHLKEATAALRRKISAGAR